MSAQKNVKRIRAFLLRQKSSPHAPSVRTVGSERSIVVTVGHTDLPAFVSDGILYIQAPLPHIFQAFAEDLSDELRGMETRISVEGGPSLSLDSDGRPIHRTSLAFESLVPDSW
jgi:hypothetical protein